MEAGHTKVVPVRSIAVAMSERVKMARYIGGGLRAWRETLHVRDGDRNESDEGGTTAESFQLGLSPHVDEERDSVASLGELIGEIKEVRNVTHCQPWIHCKVQLGIFHDSSPN